MTDKEKAKYDAEIKALKSANENQQKTIDILRVELERLEGRMAPSATTINWNNHITADVGGKEAVEMMNRLVKNGDFNGIAPNQYGLSKQMVRILLIVYRMLNRLGLYKDKE